MKVIFFGLGSIGKRRAGILSDNFKAELFAFRSGVNKSSAASGISQIRRWRDVESLKPDVAFISNPTFMHTPTALRCASLGSHLFIEKPLSNTLKGVDALKRICRRKRLTCYTAYCLRFHPVIRKVRELVRGKKIYHVRVTCASYLPQWRPGRDHRKSYSSSRRRGGGVFLDLSHEFDYVSYIFGDIKKARAASARTSGLTVDAEDFADVLLTLRNGIHVNMHLDYFSRLNERSIKADFAGGYIAADLIGSKIRYFYRGREKIFKFSAGRDLYLEEEMRYFFANIGNPKIMNGPEESGRLLKKILEIRNG